MNLIKDPWLPITRKDGSKEKIAIHQLLDSYDENPVMELEAPRPDFKNALYQLLIGIVQVAAMPEDEEDWADHFTEPYNSEEFSKMVLKYEDCFEIDSDGAAFMQDFDLSDAEEKPVSSLLIEAPGANTIKNNQAHFIKGGMVDQVDVYWASIALYTLQTFAPSGGVGHRVGLRGGGPLTTILHPKGISTLWEKLWFNVINKEYLPTLQGDISLNDNSDIFPWLKPSQLSSKEGSELFSSEVHPFHHFFGMPRRIRLKFSCESGVCDLTGAASNCLVKSYFTKNYGNNYDGAWSHPLNAYAHDPKKPDELPISIKAQPGGIGYRHWLGQAIESERVIPAKVVKLSRESNYRRDIIMNRGFNIWAAGFDMDNMKARCWYESAMPLFALETAQEPFVSGFLSGILDQTVSLSKELNKQIKSAWANRPGDLGGDTSFIAASFWQNTELAFYELLQTLIENLDNSEFKNELIGNWGLTIKKEAEHLFDIHALAQQEEGLNMKRVVKARQALGKGIGKMIKNLNALKEEV